MVRMSTKCVIDCAGKKSDETSLARLTKITGVPEAEQTTRAIVVLLLDKLV